MKVVIFSADSNGGYPIPAVSGGAVSALVERLVDENNRLKNFKLEIVSLHTPVAEKTAKLKYEDVKFYWIKPPKIVKIFDKFIFFMVKKYKKSEKAVSFKSIFTLLFYIAKARGFVKKSNADTIIIENNIPLAWILKGNNLNSKICYHLHNVPRINAKCKDVFNKTTEFWCVSKFVAEEIEKDTNPIGPVPESKVRVFYNCIDTDRFHYIKKSEPLLREYMRRYKLDKAEFVIIFTGRLTAEKGIDILLKAVKDINRKNIRVLVVGSFHYNEDEKTDYQDYLRELSNEIIEQVTFTGYVPNDELPYLYNIADIAVLPSMWDEPAGLTNLEAMACGLPVITTNSGGITEYVGDAAIVIERNEDIIQEVGKQIIRLMDNQRLRESYSRKAICQAELFNKKKYYEDFCKQI